MPQCVCLTVAKAILDISRTTDTSINCFLVGIYRIVALHFFLIKFFFRSYLFLGLLVIFAMLQIREQEFGKRLC